MSENLRLFFLAIDAMLVVAGLCLLYIWVLRPRSSHWLFRKIRLTFVQTMWLLGFAVAVLLLQLIPYAGHWIDSHLNLGKVFCGDQHQYCYRERSHSK